MYQLNLSVSFYIYRYNNCLRTYNTLFIYEFFAKNTIQFTTNFQLIFKHPHRSVFVDDNYSIYLRLLQLVYSFPSALGFDRTNCNYRAFLYTIRRGTIKDQIYIIYYYLYNIFVYSYTYLVLIVDPSVYVFFSSSLKRIYLYSYILYMHTGSCCSTSTKANPFFRALTLRKLIYEYLYFILCTKKTCWLKKKNQIKLPDLTLMVRAFSPSATNQSKILSH